MKNLKKSLGDNIEEFPVADIKLEELMTEFIKFRELARKIIE